MNLQPDDSDEPDVNLTPLIDVVFLLLIFFMVSSTFIEHPAIQLDLPRASAAEKSQVDSLRLAITPEGEVYLDGEAIALSELSERLRQVMAENPEQVLILEADRRVGYGTVIEAIDLARQAGVKHISAFTEGAGEE